MAETFKAESISAESIIAGGQLIGDAPGADLYIDPTGDDANDGLSALTPVQSWERLFELIPLIIAQNTTVHMAVGEYQRLAAPFRVVNSGVTFSLLGATQTVYEGTPDSWPAGTDQLPFTGEAPGWTPDELIGCFVVPNSWDPRFSAVDRAKVFVVGSNTADTLTLATNKASSAFAYPVRIFRSLSYTDSTTETTFGASFDLSGWIGQGTVILVGLQARKPRQYAFAYSSSTPVLYLLACSQDRKHPDVVSFYVNQDSGMSIYGGWGSECGGLFTYNSKLLNVMNCWFSGTGTRCIIAQNGALVSAAGSRIEGYSYGIELTKNSIFTKGGGAIAGYELLGTCTIAGIYVQNGSSATVGGGAGNTLSGPMGQNVRLGDGTYKAYTDASAAELTQFTRWIKG